MQARGRKEKVVLENMGTDTHCFCWNHHKSNIFDKIKKLLLKSALTDMTLVCDGHSMLTHKIIFAAFSPLFCNLILDNPCQHPVFIMIDIEYRDLKAVVQLIYEGKVLIKGERVPQFLRALEKLNIEGFSTNSLHGELVPTEEGRKGFNKVPAFSMTDFENNNIKKDVIKTNISLRQNDMSFNSITKYQSMDQSLPLQNISEKELVLDSVNSAKQGNKYAGDSSQLFQETDVESNSFFLGKAVNKKYENILCSRDQDKATILNVRNKLAFKRNNRKPRSENSVEIKMRGKCIENSVKRIALNESDCLHINEKNRICMSPSASFCYAVRKEEFDELSIDNTHQNISLQCFFCHTCNSMFTLKIGQRVWMQIQSSEYKVPCPNCVKKFGMHHHLTESITIQRMEDTFIHE